MARLSTLGVKARFLDSYKRRKGRQTRYEGGDPFIATKDKVIRCPRFGCNHLMEFWYEDRMGDLIYSCTNPLCYKSKDWCGSPTIELKKLTKEMQMNSRKFYRSYDGSYW